MNDDYKLYSMNPETRVTKPLCKVTEKPSYFKFHMIIEIVFCAWTN